MPGIKTFVRDWVLPQLPQIGSKIAREAKKREIREKKASELKKKEKKKKADERARKKETEAAKRVERKVEMTKRATNKVLREFNERKERRQNKLGKRIESLKASKRDSMIQEARLNAKKSIERYLDTAERKIASLREAIEKDLEEQ